MRGSDGNIVNVRSGSGVHIIIKVDNNISSSIATLLLGRRNCSIVNVFVGG